HDFNNILTSIIGYSEMVLLDLPGDSSSKNDVEQIIVSGKRATNLVRQILTFSRKEPKNLQVLNLFLVVKEVLKMLRSSLPTTVEIVENIDPECGEVLADQTQMHQVVMNLCTNAFQAMADQKGVVKVELRQLEIAPEEVSGWSREVAGSFVVLSISDTGCGMNAATRARIFEPYFTTKETGKGTGLGLAVIHGIIESCNGFIKVDSEPGQGTTFHVYMPSLEKDINLETLKTEKEVDLPTGSERIMVVDDEEAIIRLHETILQRLGYEVTSTIDSRVALAEIQSDPNAFDLLLTDQSMPNLSGAELAREVLKVKPTMPIILCTGYSSIVSEADALVLGIKRFAKKPVTLDELAHIVRQVLDENQETGEADECS
ncbi:response regulator, partial [bacterium]|nr:response regulator [bacterium]